jgi:hypothetical protein
MARARVDATTRFADDAERPARRDGEINIPKHWHCGKTFSINLAIAGGEPGDLKQRCSRRCYICHKAKTGLRGREQAFRIFVFGRGNELPDFCHLPHLAMAQHDDAIRDLRDNREIVRDVDTGGIAAADCALEGFQHLDLGGDVERGGRLVEDHDVRIGDQCHRHQPLKLTAGNLMRVACPDCSRIGDCERAEQLDRLCRGLRLARGSMNQRTFDHLRHDHPRGVERGGRALRYIGDAAPTQGSETLASSLVTSVPPIRIEPPEIRQP